MNYKRLLQNIFYPFASNRHNKALESQFSEQDRQIYGFYHVYAVNHWKDIVLEQFKDIKKYGLLEATSKIFVSLVSTDIESDIIFLKNIIGDKLEIIFRGNDPKVYEYPALEYLYSLSHKSESPFYAYYFHTKGSSNCAESVKWYKSKIRTLEQLLKISASSRRFMSYWNFRKWHLAVSVLQNGYGESYGANFSFQLPDKRFYGGNFWWAKSEFIATRKPFSMEDKQWRFTAETWLLSGVNGGFYNAYRLNTGLQRISLPSGFLSDNLINRMSSKLGFYCKCQIWGGCMIMHRLGVKIKNSLHIH